MRRGTLFLNVELYISTRFYINFLVNCTKKGKIRYKNIVKSIAKTIYMIYNWNN